MSECKSSNYKLCHCVSIGMCLAENVCKCMYASVYFKMEIIDVIVWTPWAITKSAVNNSLGTLQFRPSGKNVYSSTLIKHMCRGCMRHVNVVLFLQQMKRSGRKLWVLPPSLRWFQQLSYPEVKVCFHGCCISLRQNDMVAFLNHLMDFFSPCCHGDSAAV